MAAPNEIYLPERTTSFTASCDGTPVAGLTRDPATGLVEIDCGGEGEHTLLVEGLDGV